jgi:hypothetical protein
VLAVFLLVESLFLIICIAVVAGMDQDKGLLSADYLHLILIFCLIPQGYSFAVLISEAGYWVEINAESKLTRIIGSVGLFLLVGLGAYALRSVGYYSDQFNKIFFYQIIAPWFVSLFFFIAYNFEVMSELYKDLTRK